MLTKIWYFYILFIILEQFITLKIRSSKEYQQNLHWCSLSLDTIIIFIIIIVYLFIIIFIIITIVYLFIYLFFFLL